MSNNERLIKKREWKENENWLNKKKRMEINAFRERKKERKKNETDLIKKKKKQK